MSAKTQLSPSSEPSQRPGPHLAPGQAPVLKKAAAKMLAWDALRVRPDPKRPADADLRVASGARKFVTLSEPMMRVPDSGRALILLTPVANGSFVKKGQKIAQLDAQSILDPIDYVNTGYVQADGDAKKRRAEQAIDAGASAIRFDIDKEELKLTVDEAEAPIDRMVVIQSIFRGGGMGQGQEGDQLSPCQPEEVRISAIGVTSGRDQQFIHNIPVRVELLDQDARILPYLSGSADIQFAAPSAGLTIPMESVESENGQPFVMVRNGGRLVRHDVELVTQTDTQAMVKTDMQSGDEVVLNR